MKEMAPVLKVLPEWKDRSHSIYDIVYDSRKHGWSSSIDEGKRTVLLFRDTWLSGLVIAEGQRWETRKQRKCLLGHSLRYELKGRGLLVLWMGYRTCFDILSYRKRIDKLRTEWINSLIFPWNSSSFFDIYVRKRDDSPVEKCKADRCPTVPWHNG